MKFYNREQELDILNSHWKERGVTIDVLTGRRRIGKTMLALQYAKAKKFLYFFTSRKEILALLEEWAAILREAFPVVTSFQTIDEFLRVLFTVTQLEKHVIIFDEFQNFKYISPAAFSDFQKHIDRAVAEQRNAHILFLGSSVTLMEKVFKDKREPLFNRATRVITLGGFDFFLIQTLVRDFGFPTDILFAFNIYSLFNGIPKYYEILEKEKTRLATFEDIVIDQFLTPDGGLTKEGFFLLQSEFGRDYQRYFDILTYIAAGDTRIKEVAARLKEPSNKVAVYFHRLASYYGLIEKRLPLLNPVKSEARYYLKDTLLQFWFRYIYRRMSYIEKGASRLLWNYVRDDLSNYQGAVFEGLCHTLFATDQFQNKLALPFAVWEYGRHWDGKEAVEVDMIAYDKQKQSVLIIECKLNPKRITHQFIHNFNKKSELPAFKRFSSIHRAVITLTSVASHQKQLCEKEGILVLSIDEISPI